MRKEREESMKMTLRNKEDVRKRENTENEKEKECENVGKKRKKKWNEKRRKY